MGVYFLDASALVKYYILEPGSTWLRALVDSPTAEVVISDASLAESAAAFAILFRTGRIHRALQQQAFRSLSRHIATGYLGAIPIATADFQRAAELTQVYPLKAYDTVQLAVALRRYRQLLAFGASLTFVAGDGTLLNAALAEGLPVANPFDYVLPQDTPSHLP
jgi:predicted nucleic acid-binding protein